MSTNAEWHYIQVPKLGRAWVGWGQAKNQDCMRKHGVSFEAMMVGLLENGITELRSHPNATRYPNQHILCIEINGYMHRCPCLISRSQDDEPCFFLKTIYPSRQSERKLRR